MYVSSPGLQRQGRSVGFSSAHEVLGPGRTEYSRFLLRRRAAAHESHRRRQRKSKTDGGRKRKRKAPKQRWQRNNNNRNQTWPVPGVMMYLDSLSAEAG